MKVFICCFIALICADLHGQVKLKFEKLGPMPNRAFAFGYSQSEHEIYAIGGLTDGQSVISDMQVYNDKAQLWLDVPLKELPNMKYVSGVYLDDYKGILLAGGTQPYGSSIALVEEIRMVYPHEYEVEVLGVLPEPAKNLGIANDGNKVYLFGGSTTMRRQSLGKEYFTFSNQLFVYNLEDGHMAKLPDMPVAMETKGGVIDGKLYVLGGFTGNSLTSVWQYDIEKEVWSELPPLDMAISAHAFTQYGQYFILLGDYNDGGQLVLYDTKTQTAEYFKTNLRGRYMGASVLGNYLHVYGKHFNDQYEHFKIPVRELIKRSEQ